MILFVLLQNGSPVVGHLLHVLEVKYIDIYLMMFSANFCVFFCNVCVNNGYLHFTCRQTNPVPNWGISN